MKISLRLNSSRSVSPVVRSLFLSLALGLAALPGTVSAAGMEVGRSVARLAQLVSLTAEQKARMAEIFNRENAALQAIPTAERGLKGMPIRQQARAEIRALLTPAQQKIYDTTPQRLGGGAMQDPAASTVRVDKVVTLSDEQTRTVAAIFLKQTDAIQALTAEEREGAKGAAIRQAARVEVRAALTPEQRVKFDANPNGAEDLEVRAYMVNFLKTAPAIAARVGKVSSVSSEGGSVSTTLLNEAVQGLDGVYVYKVKGSGGEVRLTITWAKRSPTAEIKITKIEDESGQTIRP